MLYDLWKDFNPLCAGLTSSPLFYIQLVYTATLSFTLTSKNLKSRCSTGPLVLVCWELRHVIFLMLRKKDLFAWLIIHRLTIQIGSRLSLWIKIVVILWICSALHAVLSFSAWEKWRDSTKTKGHVEHLRFLLPFIAENTKYHVSKEICFSFFAKWIIVLRPLCQEKNG